MRATRLLATAAMVLAALALAAGKLEKLLPPSSAIPGWMVNTAADRGAYDVEGLYGIYDGDVPHLQKFGIQAAHQRMYKKQNKRAIVDLMRLDTRTHAQALFADRTRGTSGSTVPGVKEKSLLVSASGTTVVYFWQRNYFCTISTFGSSAADRQAAVSFAKFISAKIAKS
ncbi:MAG: hypothetical protein N2512_05890 [Armatimonadetes bacterium]|nr:hypothetical protein [Armatimonadota bacterium]